MPWPNLLHAYFSLLALDYQGDIIFSSRNVTMSRGDRLCFDVTIVDDVEIEYNEGFSFHVRLSNGTRGYQEYYYQYTSVTVNDNDGELQSIKYFYKV